MNAIREGNEEYAVQLFKELRLFIQKQPTDSKNLEKTYGEIERDLSAREGEVECAIGISNQRIV